jgi:uncharacterized protein YdeI (YjbR/CyaY-like superfamily)
MSVKFFRDSLNFQTWLKTEGKDRTELWVGFYKKDSGKASITYPGALDEALCVGWIDGVRKSLFADAYTIRFTPRKPKSQWSAVNINRVQELARGGRMQPAGLKAFEGATEQPRKYSYEQRNRAQFPAPDEKRFRANRKAWEFFQSQPPWYRRTATYWVISAKKEETRQRRLATLIADCERGRPIKAVARPASKKPSKPNSAELRRKVIG